MSDDIDGRSWDQLADATMTRLLGWNLPLNERLLYGWIVELSYRRGREGVWIRTQRHFARLTGIDEGDVTRALRGLQSTGLLQVIGARNGPKYYLPLPNGRLVEPEPVADAEQVRCALAEIEHDNAPGPGYEPGGQRRLMIATNEERLAEEQAAVSREMTMDGARLLRAGHLGKFPRCEPGILGNSQDRGERTEPPKDAGAYARARTLTSNHGTNHVRNVNVGEVAEGNDSRFALEELRALLDPQEFAAWERAWARRAREHPHILLEAIGDAKTLSRTQKIGNFGKVIFARAKELAKATGRTFRLFSL